MPRSRKVSRRSKRSRRSSRRNYKGGDGAGENMLRLVGDGDTQFNNVFGAGNTTQSNVIVPIQTSVPVGQKGGCVDCAKVGGKRPRRKGGFLGPILSQAVVPLAILGMQQTYGRNHHQSNSHRGTRRRRR
jgi:hypothetical protein